MKAWTRAAYAVGVLVLVTGCGGGGDFAGKSGDDIVKDAGQDMKGATSLRLAGEVTSDGQKFELDVQLTSKGSCQGEIKFGGGTAQLVSDGDTAWMKPDDAFWEAAAPGQAAAVEQVVGDKWVVIPSDDADFSELCDLNTFLKDVDKPSSDKMKNAGADTVDGQDAVKLTGHDDNGKPLTAWVATDSPHYFLKIEVTTGPEPGMLTFSDYNKPVKIKVPQPSEVADLNTSG
jgi:hypothetical protein